MAQPGFGLVGGIAAGRPMLAAGIIGFAAAALASVGYRASPLSYADMSIAFLAALVFVTIIPVALGAIAPKNFWLRAIYAGILAGLLLSARRLVLQSGFTLATLDVALVLAIAACAVALLAFGAALWRSALGLSLVGCAAIILGLTGGLSNLAIESAREGVVAIAGPAMALAAAVSFALCVQITAAFSRSFAEGGDNFSAAASAARYAAAPALFALAVSVFAMAAASTGAGASTAEVLTAARIAAVAAAFALAAPLFLAPASLSLKERTEMTAVLENRRRAALRPFLAALRAVLAPSTAIASSAVFLIVAIVATFETATPVSLGEIALFLTIAIAAAFVFVSLRTALLIAVLAAAAGRILSWGLDLAGVAPPDETARIAAAAFAAIVSAQLFLAWRDRRNPRRKSREVVQMALADCLFAYIAAATLGLSAFAASEAAGLWRDGVEAALYGAILCVIGLFAAPPLMTAAGALFGRD